MGGIRNYRDLEVWKQGRILVKTVYELTRQFPKEELYGLTIQIRRAAVSIPSNIAEGHSRSSTRDFIQFISMAIGSLAELDTQMLLAGDLEYIAPVQLEPILNDIAALQKMLHTLRASLRARIDLPNPQSLIPNP